MVEEKYSSGMRWLLYIVSFLFGIVGLIIGIVLMTRDDEESKQVGKNCLIAMVISIVLYCVCVLCYMLGMGGLMATAPSSALLLPLI